MKGKVHVHNRTCVEDGMDGVVGETQVLQQTVEL